MTVASNKIDFAASVAAGYTPTVDTVEKVKANIQSAVAAMRSSVVKVETSLTSTLTIAVADYAALRMCVVGSYPKDKDIKEFVADSCGGKDNLQTNLRTLSNVLILANKAGRLVADRKRTSFFVAWNRVVDGTLEIVEQKVRPSGDGWERQVMCDIAIVRPEERKGKGERASWARRANCILPAERKDIEDAYAVMVDLKTAERDGSPMAKKREEGVGAGQGAPAETKVSIAELEGSKPDQAAKYLADALLSLLSDQKAREAISEDDATIGSLNHLLGALSYHCQPDEFVTGPMPADIKDAA
ncbi:MAG: hypothetical protein IM557_11225 [Chitinophagaceae bacterium]|nr:hypothetical protein [Chitinophagaceae bacterium]